MTEQMKPSGIVWMGDIPQNWDIKRVKYLASLKGRIGWQGLTSDEYIDEGPYLITGIDFKDGGIDWDNCVHISEKRWAEAPDIHIKNGDLLITKDGTVGKVAIVSDLDGKASLNSGVLLVRTYENFDKRFLFWVLQSEEFWTWFRLKNAGNSTIIHLYQGDFAEFSYTFPEIEEQQQIAAFLDAQCAKIDGIIADIEKQIETLQKYKKSLITETVTKGLDKSVPMKDSGIEWIGKIPKHWNVKRIKHIIQKSSDGIKVGPFGSALTNDVVDHVDGEYKIYGQANLIRRDFAYGDNYVTKETYQRLINYVVLPGDIALSMMGTIGKCCVVPSGVEPGIMDSHLIKIRLSSIMLPKFFEYVYESDVVYEQLLLNSKGSIMNGLNSSVVKNVFMPLPSLDEQKELLIHLENSTKKIDFLLMAKQQQLEKLQQHKKSLIYEYVTGKKRVTEVN